MMVLILAVSAIQFIAFGIIKRFKKNQKNVIIYTFCICLNNSVRSKTGQKVHVAVILLV